MTFAFAADYRARLLALPALLRRGGADDGLATSARKGGRLEFREHRPYTPGDDPRTIDWHLYLRLDQIAVKEFEKAEAPEIWVIVDRSASMGPAGSGKDRLAREVAGGLAYVALAGGASVVLALPGEGGPVVVGRWQSAKRLDAVIRVLEELGEPAGPTWIAGIRHLPAAPGHGRVSFLVSDFFTEPLPIAAALALSRGAGGGGLLLLLGAEDRHPQIPESGTLQDRESSARLAVSDGAALLEAYAVELAAHEDAVTALAHRHGLRAVVADDHLSFERIVLECAAPEARRR